MAGKELISWRNGARATRIALPCGALALCLWVLLQQIDTVMLRALPAELARISAGNLIGAALACLLSFWAVGRYDGVAHRHLGTAIPERAAERSGRIAIVLAQTLGFGVLSGTLARWRMLPDLSMSMALRLSTFVSLSFLAGWSVITALACLTFAAPGWTFYPALLLLLSIPALIWGLFRWPTVSLGAYRMRLPSLRACGGILTWTAIDTGAAALALWLLLPTEAVGFSTVLPVFLLALGAALISGTPGGVGPFEVVILSALPQVPATELLAGVVAFRALYYALPALVAMLSMIRPLHTGIARADVVSRQVRDHHKAETGVIAQNGGFVGDLEGQPVALWPTGQMLTVLSDLRREKGRLPLHALQTAARERNLLPCLYKCDSRAAMTARLEGWHVAHIADEAVLNPGTFSAEVPARRNLRRKLRAAEKAGVRVSLAKRLPLPAMEGIDARWQRRNGCARGGTMGRFCPAYLADQMVLLAHRGDRLIAYASFHRGAQDWCLDLMRSDGDAPDGTMHLLVNDALRRAAAAGIARLSLAAVPACPDPDSRLMRFLAMQVVSRSGSGLRQFKSAFAPRWEPRYVATPHDLLTALALADIAREVYRPAPLPKVHPIHKDDEDNEVAWLRAS